MTVGTNESATITITARRTDNGQPPPNLTKAQVTTTLGSFGSVNGPQNVEVELVGGQAQLAFFPGNTIGTASIRVAIGNSAGFATIQVVERATFYLSSVSPNVGGPLGGETVTIFGGGFSEPVRVLFGTIPAQVVSVTSNQIRVMTPALVTSLSECGDKPLTCNQTVAVSVTINFNAVGQATDTLPNAFSYSNGGGTQILQPIIFSVTPSTGPNEGGTEVTINGDGFDAPVKVEFGSKPVWVEATVLSVTRTRIVVLSPPASGFGQANLNQPVDIRVTNLNTGRTARAEAAFRYGVKVLVTAISPNRGPWYGGQIVTVYGQGFEAPVAVTMGQMAQQVLSVSGTEIVVRTVMVLAPSCADVSGNTKVVNINNNNKDELGPIYTYDVFPPTLVSVSPNSVPQAGGATLTVTGSGFFGTLSAVLNLGGVDYAMPITSVSSTSLTLLSPPIPNVALCSGTCDDDNDSILGTRCNPATGTLKIKVQETTCEGSLQNSVTVIPTTACLND
jgi:hypothetical protein